MTDNNLLNSPQADKSLSTEKDEIDSNEEKPFFTQGIFSYKNKGTQGVITLFGYELTAPAGLKNPATCVTDLHRSHMMVQNQN